MIIYTAGVFDLLHRGHLNLLRESAKLGNLIVGVVSDSGAALYKRKPIQDEQTRLAITRELKCVHYALIQPTTDPTSVLEIIRPDVMTHGDDWCQLREGQETLSRLGIKWQLIPYTEGISTTLLIQALL